MSPEAFIATLPSTFFKVAGKGALIALVVLGAVFALRRASAASRHLVLSLGVAALLALPAVTALLPSLDLAVLPAARGPVAAGMAGEAQPSPLPAAAPASLPRPDAAGQARVAPAAVRRVPPLAAVLSLLAMMVPAVLLARLALALRHLAWLRRTCLPPPREWLDMLSACRSWAGVAQDVCLGVSPSVAVPVTFGWLRPVVLLPEVARTWGEQPVREVLVHELAHVRRRDWLVQVTARVACALHWFDPLVWLLARRLLLEAELACDDQVLRAGVGPTGYAERLVALARQVRGAARRPAVAAAFARPSGLASRVTAILDPARRRGGPGRVGGAAAAAACMMLLLWVAPVRLVRAQGLAGDAPARVVPAPAAVPGQDLPPLLRAAWDGDEREVKRLLAAGADPDQAVAGKGTPLILAATRGHRGVVSVLLEAGADPALVEAAGARAGNLQRSPLGAAARQGDARVVRRLLAAGAPADQAPPGDGTPLMNAAERAHREVVDLLLGAGAKPDAVIPGDGTPLIAAARGGDPQVVHRLLAAGADPNVRVPGDETPLQQAVENGHAEAARLLLAAGARPIPTRGQEDGEEEESEDSEILDGEPSRSADAEPREARENPREPAGEGTQGMLLAAAGHGDVETLRRLLTAGADPNQVVDGDGTPLIAAAREGRMEAVRLLLEAGASPDGTAEGDGSPLIAAAREGHVEVARRLLEAGADMDLVVPGDENPLIQAAGNGRLEVVRLLLDAGADPNARVVAGSPGEVRTPLRAARRGGHRAVERLLLERGARE